MLINGFKKGLIAGYGNHIFFLKTALCVGRNQLLQFLNERFMPEAFENPEGLFF